MDSIATFNLFTKVTFLCMGNQDRVDRVDSVSIQIGHIIIYQQ